MSRINLDQHTDFELLKLIKQDKRIFDVIYRRYIKQIYRFCYNRLGYNKELTEDIVSTTFLKAIEAIDNVSLEKDKTLLPWLYTIARNTIYTHTKRNKSKHNVSMDEDISLVSQENGNIEEQLYTERTTKQVLSILKRFSQWEQDIIYLKIYESMTFKEIAEIVGMRESAVKMRYYRLIKKVTKLLEKS